MGDVSGCVQALREGKTIAYPTEAVFGLGCDPQNISAIKALLALKQREKSKGLILIAASIEQLDGFVDFTQLAPQQFEAIKASWPGPGPVTWLVPAAAKASDWICGQFSTIAVRVSAHEPVRQLCQAWGAPVISTSANLSGQPPCKTAEEVAAQFGASLPFILQAEVGIAANPSQICDAKTGKIIRAG
ncbi:MAG: Sua5/YciO/YrdC/YwlC family protein [Vibrionaceae bacterium]